MPEEINIETLFKNLAVTEEETSKEDKLDPLEILSLRDETLDLYTAIDKRTLTNLVKNRLIMDVFFTPDSNDQVRIMENYDTNIRALSVSIDRKGRDDVKEIHSVNILSNLLQEERSEEGEVTQTSFSRFKKRLGFK